MNAKRDRGNRQLEVFRLIGEGKTMKEIGDELHLSPKRWRCIAPISAKNFASAAQRN